MHIMDFNKISRRQLLKAGALGGVSLAAASTGLPVFAQDKPPELDLPVSSTGKLTVIHRTEYFEEAQTIFRDTVAAFAQANSVELDISTTNAESFGDFLGKMTAAVKAGNPPDFAYTSNVSISQMAALDLVEDVTDVVEEAIAKYGNIMTGINAEINGKIDGKWKSIPFLAATTSFMFRKDKLAEKGIDPASLTTFEARRDAALAVSSADHYGWGLTPNQSGDGYGFLTLLINAFGGHFTDETGQIVQFNSPETVAAYTWLAETYDRNGRFAAMLPPGVESWNDTGNNEAYLAGSISYTHNAFSVYANAKRNANPVFPNIGLLRAPTGNDGSSRDGGNVGGWITIFKNAPNKDLAKKLALDLINPDNFNKMASIAGGLFMPAYENLWTPELLAADPNYAIIKEQVSVATPWLGDTWPAKPAPQFGAIRAQGIVEQSVGNAIAKRMTPAEAVKDAHDKIVQLFEEGGIMQP
jgi:multiple sugar transport system substrate-binding protein